MQFYAAFLKQTVTCTLKGLVHFSSMEEISADPKGVTNLLDGLNIHLTPGPDGMNAKRLKECTNEISPILVS